MKHKTSELEEAQLDAATNKEIELWKPVVGYEGFYSVSSCGRVRGEQRQVSGKLGSTRTLPQKLMSPTKDSGGYLQVLLSRDRGKTTFKVAWLVAAAFIGPRPDGMQVCHCDGMRTNNRVGNLRYDTRSGNAADRLVHGTHTRGARSGMAKLTDEKAEEIRRDPRSARKVAASYGVSHARVTAIRRGESWVSVAPSAIGSEK